MDLVARYIAAVQRELPEGKREEIGRELRANILDQLDAMAEQRGQLSTAQVAEVLKGIGHPRGVAQQFAPQQPLISLGYMPLYQYTLFMVLGILFLLQVMQTTMAWLSGAEMGLMGFLFRLAGGYLEDAIFGFASVTVSFWLMSYQDTGTRASCDRDWDPAKLPEAGPGWQHIALQDIFTDLGTYLFLLLVIWYPVLMSAEQLAQGRYLLSDQAHQFLQWASPLAAAGIGLSLWQLRQRLWNRRLLLANMTINLALVVTTLMLVTRAPLIHPEAVMRQGFLDPAQLERSAVITLFVIASFPLWELIRDGYRLRSLRRATASAALAQSSRLQRGSLS